MLGIDGTKAFWTVVAIIVLIWLFNDPSGAASDVKGIIAWLKDAAGSILTFVREVVTGTFA